MTRRTAGEGGSRGALRLTRLTLVMLLLLCAVLGGAGVGAKGSAVVPQEEDFYAVLGLQAERDDATERQIKTAWRRLSKRYHPDVAGEGARGTYQRIQRAYEVLGDRRKRKVYDILGMDGVKKLETPSQQQQPMNPFFALFGGANVQAADRGEDMQMLLLVTLEDVYKGAAHSVRFGKTKICRACRGTGARSAADVVQCPHCHGAGHIKRVVQIAPGFVQQMQQPCPHCGGRGTHIASRCPVCGGTKVVRGEVTISVDVEAGMPEGHVLTYELEADQRPGQVPGDLLLTTATAPHPRFERRGNDLYMNYTISLREALLGFERAIPHLDEHEVVLHETGVTQHGTVTKVVGEGMPKHHVPSEHGDLYVTYHVELPAQLSAEQEAVLSDHF